MEKRTVPQAVFESPLALKAARMGHIAGCDELARMPRRMLAESNPNHPMHDSIFGYERAEFMRKQYKETGK